MEKVAGIKCREWCYPEKVAGTKCREPQKSPKSRETFNFTKWKMKHISSNLVEVTIVTSNLFKKVNCLYMRMRT